MLPGTIENCKFKGTDLKERIKTIEETVAKLRKISQDLLSSIESSKAIEAAAITLRKENANLAKAKGATH